jgi:hypothetical protein
VHKEQFEDAFLTSVLQPKDAFMSWLDEYTME